jgi:hypothetical protein
LRRLPFVAAAAVRERLVGPNAFFTRREIVRKLRSTPLVAVDVLAR